MHIIFMVILGIYNFQSISFIKNAISQRGFIQNLSPIPKFMKSSNIEITKKYLLLDIGKHVKKGNLEIGFNIIVKRGDTSQYPAKLWNNLFAADYNTLYLKYTSNRFNFLIGRVPVKWGISPLSSLIFSGYEPGIDIIYYSVDYSRFKGDYFFSILRDNENFRYLAAHRFILNIIDNVQFSFGDIILYRTKDGLPDFYYFNPLAIYYVRQWTLDSSGFTNSAFDFKSEYIYRKFHIYAELFIDDFPYIKLYHENPRIGGLTGVIYRKKNTGFILEYKRVNRFTYCYYTFAPYLSFRYFSKPLGTPEGNDFDRLTAFYWVENEKALLGAELLYIRHGEGNIFEGFRSTSEESEHYFLSGVVEKTFTTKLIISKKISDSKILYFLPSFTYIKNYHHSNAQNTFLVDLGILFSFTL